MIELTKEEQKIYDENLKDYYEELDQMEKEKEAFLERMKGCVEPEYFQYILNEIEESGDTGNYRIIDNPIGESQQNGDHMVWIVQHCGACGDDYYGTFCVKLPNNKYFIWDFEL